MSASQRAITLTLKAAQAAAAVKAEDLVAIDVSSLLPFADTFLLASGSNERQVMAIAERIEEELRKDGVRAVRKEGMRHGRWVLLDFNEIIVHVFHKEERAYYSLERLWKDGPAIPLPKEL